MKQKIRQVLGLHTSNYICDRTRGGYKRGAYKSKPSLIKVATRVEQTTKTYGGQLKQCRQELEDYSGWLF